jgi:hypothetical protein
VTEAVFVLVALLAAAYLLAPVYRRTDPPVEDPRTSLEAARAAALRSLHDLELDWGTGKLSDDDYRSQRAVMEAELAAIVRRMASVPPGT